MSAKLSQAYARLGKIVKILLQKNRACVILNAYTCTMREIAALALLARNDNMHPRHCEEGVARRGNLSREDGTVTVRVPCGRLGCSRCSLAMTGNPTGDCRGCKHPRNDAKTPKQ